MAHHGTAIEYLHYTNHRERFDQNYWTLSHGCVRVQQLDQLVAYVLGNDLAEVHRLANGRQTVDAPAPPVPVAHIPQERLGQTIATSAAIDACGPNRPARHPAQTAAMAGYTRVHLIIINSADADASTKGATHICLSFVDALTENTKAHKGLALHQTRNSASRFGG